MTQFERVTSGALVSGRFPHGELRARDDGQELWHLLGDAGDVPSGRQHLRLLPVQGHRRYWYIAFAIFSSNEENVRLLATSNKVQHPSQQIGLIFYCFAS